MNKLDDSDEALLGKEYLPLVSIVIPCYNPKHLIRTLESVQRQTYAEWEVLCVDDARLSYHRLEYHRNANVARNYGIRHSRGHYIAMLSTGYGAQTSTLVMTTESAISPNYVTEKSFEPLVMGAVPISINRMSF
jgi:cellulose synthase/poly-beta-1,6-N-acetylglucosamine synthase-like glycosyltransferase